VWKGDAQSLAGNWRPTQLRVRGGGDQIGNPATLPHTTKRQPVARKSVVSANCKGRITTKASTTPPATVNNTRSLWVNSERKQTQYFVW